MLPAQRFWAQRATVPSRSIAFDRERGRAVSLHEGATFEFDATGWTQRSPSERLSITGHSIVFHESTGETLVFGGVDSVGFSRLGMQRWDGVRWEWNAQAGDPVGREHAAMAYDRLRQRTVLFGGARSYDLDDTWEWDGGQWLARQPTVRPSARRDHAMAFHAGLGRTVLFGGRDVNSIYFDTWQWDGSAWSQISNQGPPASIAPRMAYDETRARLVLLSGEETWEFGASSWIRRALTRPAVGPRTSLFFHSELGLVCASGDAGSLWAWTGREWVQHEPRRHPPSLWGAQPLQDRRLAYDSVRGRAVTYNVGETWEFDGATWHLDTSAPFPLVRRYAMAFDPVRGQTLLFGGTLDGSTASDDTWVWDGTRWRQLAPATSPPPRHLATMAWDPNLQRVLLFGGIDGIRARNDTWAWDGTTWTQLHPTNIPQSSITWTTTDTDRRRVVMVDATQTWEWDGVDWSLGVPSPGPYMGPIAYDPVLRRTVAHRDGGRVVEWDGSIWTDTTPSHGPATGRGSFFGPMVFDERLSATIQLGDVIPETWVYSASEPARSLATAPACGTSSSAVLASFGLPALGHDGFALDLVHAASARPAAVLVASMPGSIPLGACVLLIDPGSVFATWTTVTSVLGFASARVAIPLEPPLLGFEMHAQAVTLDPSIAGALALSNALGLRIGY